MPEELEKKFYWVKKSVLKKIEELAKEEQRGVGNQVGFILEDYFKMIEKGK